MNFHTFTFKRLILRVKINEPFHLENKRNLTHEFIMPVLTRKIRNIFLLKFAEKLVCHISCIFKMKWFI